MNRRWIYSFLPVLLIVWLLLSIPPSSAGVTIPVHPQDSFDFDGTAEQAIQYASAYLQRHATEGAVGQQLRLRGSSKDALDTLERQAQLAPTDFTLQTALGVALYGASRAKEAQRVFEQVVHMNPSYAIGHCYLGYLAHYEKDLNGYVKHFEQAIQADPTYVPAYNSLAMGYLVIGYSDAALRVLTQGIARFPDETSFFSNRAYIYVSQERWEAAQEILQQAIAKQPTEHNRVLLGMILLKRQEYERARAVYTSILEANPKSIVALAGLAESYKKQHDHTKAIALIEQAIAIEPANKDLHDELREHQEAYRNWKNQEKSSLP